MTDEVLIEQFQQGQTKAFDELLKRYHQQVYSSCYRFLVYEDDCEDATQDIFIKVFRALGSFKPKAKFSTWLYRIVLNHCMNVNKSRKRKAWLKNFSAENSTELNAQKDDSGTPDDKLEQKEQAAVVKQALEKLSELDKMAVILQKYEGLSYKEIAYVMGTTVSSIESRIFRAKNKLAEYLKNYIET